MYLGIIHPDQTETLTIQFIRELTQDEVEDYTKAVAVMGHYRSYGFAPRMVYENDEDFFEVMQNCLRHYADQPSPQHLPEYTFIANKALLNYLSSVRFFTDFVSTQLARKYGSGSSQNLSFKEALSKCFDTSFAYRFLYKFRNYVQHCGAAIEQIEIKIRPNDLEQASLTLTCKTETLLEQYKEWGKVAANLRTMETVNLAKVVGELTEEIKHLDAFARSLLNPELDAAALRVKEIISDGLDRGGAPVLYEVDAPGGVLKQLPLKHPPVELLMHLGLL